MLINILHNGTDIAKIGAQFSFLYVAHWETLNGFKRATVINDGSITVTGRGFAQDITGIRYVLLFTGQVPMDSNKPDQLPKTYSAAGQVLRNQIIFTVPLWNYPEQFAQVSVYKLLSNNQVSTMVPYRGNHQDSIMEWLSVWQSALLLYNYEMPATATVATAPSVGGSVITFFGTGFSALSTPACRFTCAEAFCASQYGTLGQLYLIAVSSFAPLPSGLLFKKINVVRRFWSPSIELRSGSHYTMLLYLILASIHPSHTMHPIALGTIQLAQYCALQIAAHVLWTDKPFLM